MPQINLLKQQKESSRDILQIVTSMAVKFLAFALLAVIAYYGYLIYQSNKKTTAVFTMQSQIQNDQKDFGDPAQRNELLTRQQQLQELLKLVSAHEYWSSLLPALAQVTLKSANYLQFQALTDGNISLSVTVPSTVELDKFLQVFDLPEFYTNFYDIRVGSIGKAQIGNGLMTQFDVTMKYNPSLLQRKADK